MARAASASGTSHMHWRSRCYAKRRKGRRWHADSVPAASCWRLTIILTCAGSFRRSTSRCATKSRKWRTTAQASAQSKGTKPSRAILIDQVRAIGEFLALAAHRGGRRIVVLAPAEALNGPAANALLKLLEEPPPGAVFIAVTDELDAVLPTVRSRCVLLRAPVPTTEAALAWLRAQGVEDAEAKLAEAGGAPVGLRGRG